MRKSINLPKKHKQSEAASKDAASLHLGGGVKLCMLQKRIFNITMQAAEC